MTVSSVVTEAERWLGYECRPGNSSVFGQRIGHDGATWSGAFVDCVIRDAGLWFPACAQTGSGLAECIKERRWHENPRPGDVAFLSFPTDGGFGQLHVGIVVDVAAWRTTGTVTLIEAQINSGLQRAKTDRTGVYKRTRSQNDVLGFGRPVKPRKPLPVKPAVINPAQVRPGLRNQSVQLLQDGLAREAGLRNPERAMYDRVTVNACARFQRRIGYVGDEATGVADEYTIRRLGELTGLFVIRT